MKNLLQLSIVICCLTFSSCNSQETTNNTSLNYIAQTRGYIYTIQLNNNKLEINNNTNIKKTTLSTNQKKELEQQLLKIDFKQLTNNIHNEDLAVDKAIKGTFDLNFESKQYHFDFNHNELPEKIQQLIALLEKFTQ